MKKIQIPEEIKQEVIQIVNSFNSKTFKNEDVKFIPEFKGEYLYLNRKEYQGVSPLVRLRYTGNMKKWEFEIFKWSTETFEDEDFFPGSEFINGTVEGAMKAGNEAYPV